jgi:hypothetical protein
VTLLHRSHPIPCDGGADHSWWPDHTLIPFTDAACDAILDHALSCLVLTRGGNVHDPGATISTLVSLVAEADARLIETVADAREYGYTWDLIAQRLGSTISAARHRYADYARWRRQADRVD